MRRTLPLPAIGQARIARSGTDLTLIAYSAMVQTALAAAEELARAGVSAEVIDLRTLLPLDMTSIATSVSKTHRVLIAHEAVLNGGFGAEIAARIGTELFDELDAPILRVGCPFSPIPFAPELEQALLPGSATLVQAAQELLGIRALAQGKIAVGRVAVEIPKIGLVMETVQITRWLKNVGDTLALGEPLLEVETEKSMVEIEAAVSGRLEQILVPAGREAKVGDQIAWVESEQVPVGRPRVQASSRQRLRSSGAPRSPAPPARQRHRTHPQHAGGTPSAGRTRPRTSRHCRDGSRGAGAAGRCRSPVGGACGKFFASTRRRRPARARCRRCKGRWGAP